MLHSTRCNTELQAGFECGRMSWEELGDERFDGLRAPQTNTNANITTNANQQTNDPLDEFGGVGSTINNNNNSMMGMAKYNPELSHLHPYYGAQPQVRILTRNKNNNSGTNSTNSSGGPQQLLHQQHLGHETSSVPSVKQRVSTNTNTLTLQEREKQYEEARKRILGPNT